MFGLLVVFGLLRPIPATAQSLGDVARAEEARRKSIKQPAAKVYTNEDLTRGGDTPPAPAVGAPGPAPATTTPAGENKAAEAKAAEEKKAAASAESPKDEKYWRGRITAARSALERSKIFLDALQSRINALGTEFVNIDDPAHRAQVDQDRQRLIAEQERVKTDITQQTKAITDTQEEARKANVPPGWLR
jgi:hypothetical protein